MSYSWERLKFICTWSLVSCTLQLIKGAELNSFSAQDWIRPEYKAELQSNEVNFISLYKMEWKSDFWDRLRSSIAELKWF